MGSRYSRNPYILEVICVKKMVLQYRIGSDLKVYESKDGKNWKFSKTEFPNALLVVRLFNDHENLDLIKDSKDQKFLKGFLIGGQVRGARINILPTKEKLDKAYSLFSPHLTIHDETSHGHWDVIFQNPNGKFAYVYTLEKSKLSKEQKYGRVEKFAKVLPELKSNLKKALGKDRIVLPILILLETKMRVGSERYYKANHHKGLTTLKKSDLKINGDEVTFNYIGKDGVPQNITKRFPKEVIEELKKILDKIKKDDFVFLSEHNKIFTDIDFEKAFKKYSGISFYPHIVRSYYATQETKTFLISHNHPTKEEVKQFYLHVADELGHKKFSKKTHEWVDSFQVTLGHYIRPDLVEKIAEKVKGENRKA